MILFFLRGGKLESATGTYVRRQAVVFFSGILESSVEFRKAFCASRAASEGAKYLFFFLLSFPQNQRKLYWFCSVCILCFFDIIVNFIIQKLKSKHTSLKKYTN